MANPAVKTKTAHYHYFRGTLVLRFVMAASQFIKGRMLISYDVGGVAGAAAFDRLSFTNKSNLPHIILDPGMAMDKIMRIPFHFKFPYAELIGPEIGTLGLLSADNMVDFVNVSTGTPTNVNVRIFAWMEDVELKISTLEPQSKKKHAEFQLDRPISTAASAISGLASSLSNVPIIGKFAKATEIGANLLGTVANVLGYTRPANVSDVNFVKLRAVGNIATASGTDPIQKLSLDPKSERSIGSAYITATNDDMLEIANIVTRPSYLGVDEWTDVDALGHLLLTIPITVGQFLQPAAAQIDMTNLGYVGAMFTYWRGSIKFKFSLIKTKYNKGKLRITWSPSSVIPTDSDMNLGYNQVWDISENPEHDVCVPFNTNKPWLPIDFDVQGAVPQHPNGYLFITVLETLTGPADSATVEIQTWISGGDDMLFSVPTMKNIRPLITKIPTNLSAIATVDIFPSYYPDASIGDEVYIKGPVFPQSMDIAPSVQDENWELQTMGESIRSLRALCTRYSYDHHLQFDSNQAIWVRALPNLPGLTNNSITTGASLSSQSYLTYIMPSFYAYRGSARFKAIGKGPTFGSLYTATRDFAPAWSMWTFPSSAYHAGVQGLTGAAHGTAIASTSLDGSLEFEAPYYSNLLFSRISLTTSGGREDNGVWITRAEPDTDLTPNNLTLLRAVGDDFALDFYLGPPRFYNFFMP